MRYLKSTKGLKVAGLGDSIFLAWIPNYNGIFAPKLRYRHDLNGNLEFIRVQGQLKAISVNSSIMCFVLIIVMYLDCGFVDFNRIYPIILGIVGFMIILNFMLIKLTKRNVEKQKQRHANTILREKQIID
ncbi:MAG: hypothetical protein M0P66_04730 [Salinivirgaceae bacterium]|nr:hypothetical protein [Salinivirgaceae bacterium]